VAREKTGKRIQPAGIQLIEGSLRIAINPSSRAGIEFSRSSFAFLEVFRVSHGKPRFWSRRASLNWVSFIACTFKSGRRPLLRMHAAVPRLLLLVGYWPPFFNTIKYCIFLRTTPYFSSKKPGRRALIIYAIPRPRLLLLVDTLASLWTHVHGVHV
jgi:hypothetical protein